MISRPVAIGLVVFSGQAAAYSASDPLSTPFPAAVDLSTLDGTTGFSILGAEQGDRAGYAAAPAGDVNGDGVDDLLIGARRADPSGRAGAGRVYVLFGRKTATTSPFPARLDLETLDSADGLVINGIRFQDRSGYSVAGVGDVNGDGRDDILIGATQDGRGALETEGEAYIVFGRSETTPFPLALELADLDGSNGFRMEGVAQDARTGVAVAGAGDVNGDGVADLLVGADDASPKGRFSAGNTYVVFGRNSAAGEVFPAIVDLAGLDGTQGFGVVGASTGDDSGRAVSASGDMNGDGIDDFLIGARWVGIDDIGNCYLLFGRSDSAFPLEVDLDHLPSELGVTLKGASANDETGYSVAGSGDINGDGLSDAVIAARLADDADRVDAGTVYVVYGRTTAQPFPADILLGDLRGQDGFRIVGAAAGDTAGVSVSLAGDVNGDGLDDLLVGAPMASPSGRSQAGTTYLLYGRVGDFQDIVDLAVLDPALGTRFEGGGEDENSGRIAQHAGDLNGDGISDIVIGAPFAPVGDKVDAGTAYVIFGRQPGCRVDVDRDGVLTVFDFLAYQNLFAAGDICADYDEDGEITLFDFLLFQNEFDVGC